MLYRQLVQDGGSTYSFGEPTRKVLNSYTELKMDPRAKPWDPSETPNPRSMVMLYSEGGNAEGDLAFVSDGMIGGGSYGNVYRAVVLDRDKRAIPVVVKLTNKAEALPPKSFVNEVLTMWDNSSDPKCEIYATCLYGVFRSRFSSAVPDKYLYGIVMESMEGDLIGLSKSIGNNPENTPESKLYFLIYCGLHMIYDVWRLHEKGYYHNDVKPANFLYTTMANGGYRIKLADFGISCSRKNIQLEQRLKDYQTTHKIDVTPPMYASYIPCHAIGTLSYMSDTMKLYQQSHGMRQEIIRPSLFMENDIYAITVSLKQIAGWLRLTETDTDFRSYNDTPVSKALYTERASPLMMLDAYNKAILYFERRGVPMPRPAPPAQITPGDISQLTKHTELTEQLAEPTAILEEPMDAEMLPPVAARSRTQLQTPTRSQTQIQTPVLSQTQRLPTEEQI